MKFTELRPMLWTADLYGTVDFYTNILGFVCVTLNENLGWASLVCDNVGIMLALPNEHTAFEKPVFTGSLYINTDNVDEIWERLKDKVKLCYPIEDFEYRMREFAIYDNNGYIIQFGQIIPDNQ
jgi:catechol 2,3-dioxygenase-like lactoylglutathione lyase family enzyme